MTLPVIHHRESFGWTGFYNANADFVGFDQLYMQTAWAPASLAGWVNNAGFKRCQIVPSTRGGYAVRGDTNHRFAIQLARVGITPASTGIGTAFAYNQGGNVGSQMMVEFGTEDGAYRHLYIATDVSGRVAAYNGDSGAVLGVSDGTTANAGVGTVPFFMPVGANTNAPPMAHVEVAGLRFHPTLGTVQVKINEQLVLNLTNKTTLNPNTGDLCGLIQVHVPSTAVTLADWVIHDASGTGWIGDVSVFWAPAASAGNYTAGTPGGSGSPATNLAAVKDLGAGTSTDQGLILANTGSDGDTSYVTLDDSGVPKAFSTIIRAFPADAKAILEVAPLSLCRKDDGGTSTARVGMRVSGTEVDIGSDQAIPSGYTPFQFGRQTNPHTSAAWAVTDVIDVFHRRTA